jgi:hypothetical protein
MEVFFRDGRKPEAHEFFLGLSQLSEVTFHNQQVKLLTSNASKKLSSSFP